MTNKRFVTNKWKIYDLYKDDEWLVNEVEAEEIVEMMNNLDSKARERSKALSNLQKENNQLKQKIQCNIERIQILSELLDLADAIIDLSDNEKAKSVWGKKNIGSHLIWEEILKKYGGLI